MSISGSLEDVTVADVLQFVYLGRSTGTLTLRNDVRQARVGFHEGDIIHAKVTGSPLLGQALVDRGLLDQEKLKEVVAAQNESTEHSAIGDLLIDQAIVAEEDVIRVLVDLTRQTILKLFSWRGGNFRFERDSLAGFPDVEQLSTDERIFRLKIRTEGVLLEAAKFLDESFGGIADAMSVVEQLGQSAPTSKKEVVAGTPSPGDDTGTIFDTDAMKLARAQVDEPQGVAPEHPSEAGGDFEDETRELSREELHAKLEQVASAAAPRINLPPELRELHDGVKVVVESLDQLDPLTILSYDEPLLKRILSAIREHPSLPIELEQLETHWTIVDVRPGQYPLDTIDVRQNEGAARGGMLAIVDDIATAAQAYERGATAALAAIPDELINSLASLVSRSRQSLTRLPSGRVNEALIRLKGILNELRTDAVSTNATLTLMNLVSEAVERALIFSATPDGLKAIGAFGFGADRRSLAVSTPSLTVDPDDMGVLNLTARDGLLRVVRYSEAGLPKNVQRVLGAPTHEEVIILPIRGVEKIQAVVYADNGTLDQPIKNVELLEIASGQVGVALENEVLRRELVLAKSK